MRSPIRNVRVSALVFLTLCIGSPLWAEIAQSAKPARSEEPCNFGVRVMGEQGQPVAAARVSSLEQPDVSRVTDRGGLACFADVIQSLPADASFVVTAAGWAVGSASLAGAPDTPSGLSVVLKPAFGEELVVTATGSARRLADVPVHIEQIDRMAIVASGARSLAEALDYTPGLRIESNCQNCNTSQVRLLGLEGPYTQVVVEGQPTVSSLALVYGLEQIPAQLLDGIEVLKGSGSAIYGAGSVAGTINLLPHQSDHSHVDVDLENQIIEGSTSRSGRSLRALADWASENRQRSASLYGQADEVPAVDVDGDGFSEVTQRDLLALGARWQTLALAQKAQLSADLAWTEASRRGGDLDNFHLPPDRSSLTEAIDTVSTSASLRWLHTYDSKTDYRLSLSWVDIERDSYYGAGFDPNAYGRSEGQTSVFSTQTNHALGQGTLSWGLQAERDELFDEQLGYDRLLRENRDNLAVFVQDDRKLASSLSLLYGVRVDKHSSLDRAVLSPRLAALYSPRPNLTLRVAYGFGFRPPATFDEDLHIELVGGGTARVVRDAEDLVEEQSRSALLSLDWRPTVGRRGNAAFEIALFRVDLDDLFFNREADDPSTPELELLRVNLQGAEVQGVELNGSLRWGSRFQIDGGLVLQSARFDQPEPDFGSRDFYRTPENYGTLSLLWSLRSNLNLFLGGSYTGTMLAPHYAGFISEDRLEQTASFVTIDAKLSYTWALGGERELVLSLAGRNLANEFQEDLDQGAERDSSYVYGPRYPRSWSLAAGVRF